MSASRRDFLKGKAAVRSVRDSIEKTRKAVESLLPGEEDIPAPTSGEGSPPADSAEPNGMLVALSRRAMACEFEINLPLADRDAGTPAALAALDLVDRIETQLTVYRETSDIIELNRRATVMPVPVENRLFGLFELAQRLAQLTQGAFDITCGPLSEAWGFSRRQGRLPSTDEIEHALARVDYRKVQLEPDAQTVAFASPLTQVNFNGIGKGYALDRVAESFREQEIDDFLLHGGNSSVLSSGESPSGSPWCVGIRDPHQPQRRLLEVSLNGEALGTSGSGTQFFHHEGKKYGHVLDPRTGWPAAGVLSATALAPTAAEADALATAFFVLGPQRSQEICRQHEQLGAILLLPESGQKRVEACVLGAAKDVVKLL